MQLIAFGVQNYKIHEITVKMLSLNNWRYLKFLAKSEKFAKVHTTTFINRSVPFPSHTSNESILIIIADGKKTNVKGPNDDGRMLRDVFKLAKMHLNLNIWIPKHADFPDSSLNSLGI